MRPTDFSKNLSDFLSLFLPGEKGVSYNTVCAYKDAFLLFLKFMKEMESIDANKLKLKDITRERVVGFLGWLQNERHCSDSTRNARLAALRSFFRYLQYRTPERMHEWQRILSVPIKKSGKPAMAHIALDGIKLLLEQPDRSTPKGKRDLAMLSLLYDSGARVQELIDLMPSSINFNRPYTIRIIGKGNKKRIVPLMENQVELLNEYMENNRLLEPYASAYPLFRNNRLEKLSRMGVTYVLKKYANMARVENPVLVPDNITPHILRHSKAMHLLQSGVNLVYIRDFLGHASISTTEIYARADSRSKREALEKAYVGVLNDENNKEALWVKDAELLGWLKNL